MTNRDNTGLFVQKHHLQDEQVYLLGPGLGDEGAPGPQPKPGLQARAQHRHWTREEH